MLTMDHFSKAARVLACDIPSIRAVAQVESAGDGMLPDGRPIVLFEGHIFHRYTAGQWETTHPNISYKHWTVGNYCRGKDRVERGICEWKKLDQAVLLDHDAGHMSASWGRFQVMGFNFALCGFTNVDAFVDAMFAGEQAHLDAFVSYVYSVGLDDELRNQRWQQFARKYNGPDYRRNNYDIKLANAYRQYASMSMA